MYINDFIIHGKRNKYSFDYRQVTSSNVKHTQDLKNMINCTTNMFNSDDLVPAPKNIEAVLTTTEQRELNKKFLMK